MTKPSNPHVIRYIRWSSDQQTDGSSLTRQTSITDAFAQQRGWTITETIVDAGKSGWTGEHLKSGELGKLEARILDGEFEGSGAILIGEKVDRFGRLDPLDTANWFRKIAEAGVTITTCDDAAAYDAESLRRDPTRLLMLLLKSFGGNWTCPAKVERHLLSVTRFVRTARG